VGFRGSSKERPKANFLKITNYCKLRAASDTIFFMYCEPFSPKQLEFILNSNAKYNLAHGSVRSGKTVGCFFKFLQQVMSCPGESIWLLARSLTDVYKNCIYLIFDHPSFAIFAPFCTWHKGDKILTVGSKTVNCLGCGDEGAVGAIQGKTMDLCYCNEMTLYPENVIQMILSRLSMPHSKLYAEMNPVNPDHICKRLIDFSETDKDYYQSHWNVDDNPYLTEGFKKDLRQTLSGLFLRRNYYGEWCLAEGSIFDFFERKFHVVDRPSGTTLYWIAGIDYGTDHAFACILIRVSQLPQGKQLWAEKEYYYSSKDRRTKSPSEYVEDLQKFFEGYAIRSIYLDPSAAMFKAELSRRGLHTLQTNNDVYDGIISTVDAVKNGTLVIGPACENLIREMQTYVWDPKASKNGKESPLKQNDDAVDALRYAVKSYMKNRANLLDDSTDDPFGGSLVGKKPPPPGSKDSRLGIDTGDGWRRF
jgi:PBSX family phage terminase large subunit